MEPKECPNGPHSREAGVVPHRCPQCNEASHDAPGSGQCGHIMCTACQLRVGLGHRCTQCNTEPGTKPNERRNITVAVGNGPVAGPSSAHGAYLGAACVRMRTSASPTDLEVAKRPAKRVNTTSNSTLKDTSISHVICRPDGSYECTICRKVFTSKSNRAYHRYCDQTIPKPFHCDHCKRAFASRHHLDCHKKTHEPLNMQCPRCERSFQSVGALRKHNRKEHLGTLKFECHVCGKRFLFKNEFMMHELKHSEDVKPFKCDLCERTFWQKFMLTQHLQSHSDARSYQCYICKKMFTRASSVRTHLLVHSDDRVFQCACCPKNFQDERSLARHSLTHTKEQLFQCTLCSAQSARRDNMLRHLRNMHPACDLHQTLSQIVVSSRELLSARRRRLETSTGENATPDGELSSTSRRGKKPTGMRAHSVKILSIIQTKSAGKSCGSAVENASREVYDPTRSTVIQYARKPDQHFQLEPQVFIVARLDNGREPSEAADLADVDAQSNSSDSAQYAVLLNTVSPRSSSSHNDSQFIMESDTSGRLSFASSGSVSSLSLRSGQTNELIMQASTSMSSSSSSRISDSDRSSFDVSSLPMDECRTISESSMPSDCLTAPSLGRSSPLSQTPSIDRSSPMFEDLSAESLLDTSSCAQADKSVSLFDRTHHISDSDPLQQSTPLEPLDGPTTTTAMQDPQHSANPIIPAQSSSHEPSAQQPTHNNRSSSSERSQPDSTSRAINQSASMGRADSHLHIPLPKRLAAQDTSPGDSSPSLNTPPLPNSSIVIQEEIPNPQQQLTPPDMSLPPDCSPSLLFESPHSQEHVLDVPMQFPAVPQQELSIILETHPSQVTSSQHLNNFGISLDSLQTQTLLHDSTVPSKPSSDSTPDEEQLYRQYLCPDGEDASAVRFIQTDESRSLNDPIGSTVDATEPQPGPSGDHSSNIRTEPTKPIPYEPQPGPSGLQAPVSIPEHNSQGILEMTWHPDVTERQRKIYSSILFDEDYDEPDVGAEPLPSTSGMSRLPNTPPTDTQQQQQQQSLLSKLLAQHSTTCTPMHPPPPLNLHSPIPNFSPPIVRVSPEMPAIYSHPKQRHKLMHREIYGAYIDERARIRKEEETRQARLRVELQESNLRKQKERMCDVQQIELQQRQQAQRQRALQEQRQRTLQEQRQLITDWEDRLHEELGYAEELKLIQSSEEQPNVDGTVEGSQTNREPAQCETNVTTIQVVEPDPPRIEAPTPTDMTRNPEQHQPLISSASYQQINYPFRSPQQQQQQHMVHTENSNSQAPGAVIDHHQMPQLHPHSSNRQQLQSVQQQYYTSPHQSTSPTFRPQMEPALVMTPTGVPFYPMHSNQRQNEIISTQSHSSDQLPGLSNQQGSSHQRSAPVAHQQFYPHEYVRPAQATPVRQPLLADPIRAQRQVTPERPILVLSPHPIYMDQSLQRSMRGGSNERDIPYFQPMQSQPTHVRPSPPEYLAAAQFQPPHPMHRPHAHIPDQIRMFPIEPHFEVNSPNVQAPTDPLVPPNRQYLPPHQPLRQSRTISPQVSVSSYELPTMPYPYRPIREEQSSAQPHEHYSQASQPIDQSNQPPASTSRRQNKPKVSIQQIQQQLADQTRHQFVDPDSPRNVNSSTQYQPGPPASMIAPTSQSQPTSRSQHRPRNRRTTNQPYVDPQQDAFGPDQRLPTNHQHEAPEPPMLHDQPAQPTEPQPHCSHHNPFSQPSRYQPAPRRRSSQTQPPVQSLPGRARTAERLSPRQQNQQHKTLNPNLKRSRAKKITPRQTEQLIQSQLNAPRPSATLRSPAPTGGHPQSAAATNQTPTGQVQTQPNNDQDDRPAPSQPHWRRKLLKMSSKPETERKDPPGKRDDDDPGSSK